MINVPLMVWSHRADLGGGGITLAMHKPCNINTDLMNAINIALVYSIFDLVYCTVYCTRATRRASLVGLSVCTCIMRHVHVPASLDRLGSPQSTLKSIHSAVGLCACGQIGAAELLRQLANIRRAPERHRSRIKSDCSVHAAPSLVKVARAREGSSQILTQRQEPGLPADAA